MYIVSYDISSDRIRNKVAKEMQNFGQRVQYSVFECQLTDTQLQKMYGRLATLMQSETDGNIRIYKLCGKCEQDIMTIGTKSMALSLEEEQLFII